MAKELERLIKELRLSRLHPPRSIPEKAGMGERVRQWGIVVALVAGIVSLPGTVITVGTALLHRPNSIAYPGPEIEFSLNPTTRTVRIDFNLTISNAGNDDDVIRALQATLEAVKSYSDAPAPIDRTLPLQPPEIQLFDRQDGRPMLIPFSIGSSKSRDAQCLLSTDLTIGQQSLFTTGRQRLSVYLTAKRRKLDPLVYCFDLSDDFTQHAAGRRRFGSAVCTQ
jgi:hypothetical protein